MKSIAVVGAGQVGAAVAHFLTLSGAYEVRLLDHRAQALAAAAAGGGAVRLVVDAADPEALARAVSGCWAVVSTAPFHLTLAVALAANRAGAHHFDLTEDVASTRAVARLGAEAQTLFAPQCGLAPGFVTILAHDLCRSFDTLDEVRLRVGALPQFPSGALGYALTWSLDGVINEYLEPCDAIVEGVRRETAPLEECESFMVEGVAYEAFNTSGGLGSLCETLAGQVRTLNYRTIRYPGHAAVMKTLLRDLGLGRRRALLKEVLEGALAPTLQDLVLILVTVTGQIDGRRVQTSRTVKIVSGEVAGTPRSAIQIATASGVCAVLDLLRLGRIKDRGLLRQEEISLSAFLETRFGAVFGGGSEALQGLARAPKAAFCPGPV